MCCKIANFVLELTLNDSVNTKTKDDYLEIKFNNRNQVNDKIALGLGGGFLSLHQVLSANTLLLPLLFLSNRCDYIEENLKLMLTSS